MAPPKEPPLTAAEVATMFRVNPKTPGRWAKAGKIPAFRTPTGQYRFPEAEVRALLAGAEQKRSA